MSTPSRQSRPVPTAALACALGAAFAAAFAAGCGDGPSAEPPPREARGGAEPAAPGDPLDPEAADLTDLARLSRYVFREMKRRGEECAPDPVPSGRTTYTLELQVTGARIRSVRLQTVSAELGGFAAPLLPERWPPGLVASVQCLEPHLVALDMPTPPADGVYESRFSLGGETASTPTAAATAAPAGAAELPDPAEPGLPDLQRIARHVFVELHRAAEQGCTLRNPLRDRLGYVVEVEVRNGAIARAAVTEARVERADRDIPLTRDAWPEALARYADCLVPRLEGRVLDPPPADGVYRPDYAVAPE